LSQPLSWLSTEKTKPNTANANKMALIKTDNIQKANLNQQFINVCTAGVHNIPQNSLPSYPPDNHHSSELSTEEKAA